MPFIMRDGLAAYVPDAPPVKPCAQCGGTGWVRVPDWDDDVSTDSCPACEVS